MGKHPSLSALIETFLFFCLLTVAFSDDHGNHESEMEKNSDKEDKFGAKMQELLMSSSISKSGCNVQVARMCLNHLTNATVDAMIKYEDREKKCKEAWRMSSCIQTSLSGCPSDMQSTPGVRALHPYISLLNVITTTTCSEDFRPEKVDAYQNCNMETIGSCIVGFVYIATDTSSTSTCWQAKQTRTCLSTASKHCHSKQVKNLVSLTNGMLSQTAHDLCTEPGCHVSMAKECLYISKHILLSPLASVRKSPILCGAMMSMMACVTSNTRNCGEDVYSEMGSHIMHLHEVVSEVCENNTMMMTMTDPFVGHIASFLAVALSPYASKETVCPFYESAVYKTLDMIKENKGHQEDLWYTMSMASHIARGLCHHDSMCEDMGKEKMMEPMCDPQRAGACMKYADIMSLVDNVDVLGWDTVCHESLKMAECVHNSMSGCKNMEMPEETNKTLHALLGLVASQCPMEPILTKISCLQSKCEIHEALEKCFFMPNATTLAAAEGCMLVNKTMHCLHEMTSGCAMSPSLLPVKYATKQYLDMMRPYCYTPVEKHEGHNYLQRTTRCMFNFMDGFQRVMTSSTNYSSSMCHLFKSMDKECGHSNDTPSALQPGAMFQRKLMEEVIIKHCKMMEEMPGMCPTVDPDQMGHCADFCDSNNKCSEGKMCCSNACGHVCMEPVHDNTDRNMMTTTREPDSCDVHSSAGYISNYWLRLMEIGSTPAREIPVLCSSKDWFGMAIKSKLVNCSPVREQVIMDAWSMVEAVHKHVCKVDMSMMSYDEDDHMCHMEAASKCIEDFQGTLIMATPFYNNDTCMQLHNTMKCLHHSLKDCSHDAPEVAAIKDKMPFVMSMLGNACLKYFSGPEMCDMKDNIAAKAINKMECDKATASMCVGYFDTAKPMVEQRAEDLCMAVKGAKMCVYAKTNNCSDHKNVHGSQNLTQVIDYLTTFCPEMMKSEDEETKHDDEDDDKSKDEDDMTKDEMSCYLLQPVAPCTTSVEACFNGSMVPDDICSLDIRNYTVATTGTWQDLVVHQYRNKVAIQACISLATIGCDDVTFAAFHDHIEREGKDLPCVADILPTPPKNFKRSNMTFPTECFGNATDLKNFVQAKDDPEERICTDMPLRVKCLKEKYANLPTPGKMVAHKLMSAFEKLIFFKCETTEKILDKKEMLNETVTGNCSLDTVAMCMSGYSDGWMFGLTSPLGDRRMKCGQRMETVKCVHEAAKGCSEMVKANIMAMMGLIEGISQSVGICSEEMPHHCDKKGAMKCVSQLGTGLVWYSDTEMEPVMCAAISPVEKCVIDKTITCEPSERLSVEASLIQVTTMARSMCARMDHKMEEYKRGDCNVKRVVHCSTQILNKVSMLLQGQGDERHTCREIEEMEECVETHSMDCPGEDGRKIESHKPLFKLLIQGACSKEMKAETTEAGHCMTIAGSCLTQYLYLAIKSYTGMCSQVVPSLACLKSAVDMCPKPQRNVVGMAAKHLATISMENCGSKGCDTRMAYKCLSEAGMYIKAAGSKLLQTSMHCGSLMLELKCAMNHTVHCNMKDDPYLYKSIEGLKTLVYKMCPKAEHNPALSYGQNMTGVESILPLAILISSPSVTKEMLCPQGQIAYMRYTADAMHQSVKEMTESRMNWYTVEKIIGTYCHDEKWTKSHDGKTVTCNVSMVMECAAKANIPYKISSSALYGVQPICDATQQLLCCIYEKAGACINHNDIYATTQLSVDIVAMVMDTCPVMEMLSHAETRCRLPPEPCNTHKALSECYVPITSRDNITALCRNLTEVENCFHRNLKGCMSLSKAPLVHIIKSYRSMCNVDQDVSGMIPADQVSGLNACFMESMDEISKSLRTTKAPFRSACHASEKEATCLGKMSKMPPPMVAYLGMAGQDMDHEFKEKFCNQSEDTKNTLIGEPFACMAEVAEMCVTTYYARMWTWRFIPVGDREGACKELLEVESCVNHALKSCSPDRQQMYKSFMEMIYFVHDYACPAVPRRTLLLYQDSVCYRETATMCIEGFGGYLATRSGMNHQETCRHFHQTMQCVTYSTRNCTHTADDQKNLDTMLKTAYSIMGNTCPLLSVMICNMDKWKTVFHMAACEPKAAEKCQMEFTMALPESMDNDTAMCSMYQKAMECSALKTLLCDHDSSAMVNQSSHIAKATYGEHCEKINGESSVLKCMKRQSCTLYIEKCFPEKSEDICSHTDEIEKCLMKQEEGCQDNFKMDRHSLIKNHLMMKNVSCDIMSALTTPERYADSSLGLCYLAMQNLTHLFLDTAYPTDIDLCYGIGVFRQCIEGYSKPLGALWKGAWLQIAEQMEFATDVHCKYFEYLQKEAKEDDNDSADKDDDDDSADKDDDNKDDDDDSDEKHVEFKDDDWMTSTMDDIMYSKINFTEPKDCNVMAGAKCMMEYITMTMHVANIPIVDRPGVCWYKKNMLTPCLVNTTGSCSARMKRKFIKMYEVTKRIESAIGQCPEEKMAMDDTAMQSSKDGCHIEEAGKCMGMLSGVIIGNAGKSSHTMICSSILPVYSCVVEYTWMCKKEQLAPIEKVWNDVHAVAMSTCLRSHEQKPETEPKCGDMMMTGMKGSCDLPEALSCFTSWHSKSMSMDEDICRGIPALRSCVVKHLSTCEKTHKEAFEKMFAGIHRKIEKRCPHSKCDICGAANCMKELNTTKSDMTCFDSWKIKHCVTEHIESCSEEEKKHVHTQLAMKMEKIPALCREKKTLDMCALEFKDMAKKLLGLKLDLNWGMDEDEIKDDMEDKDKDDDDSDEKDKTDDKGVSDTDKDSDSAKSDAAMKEKMTMENIVKHLLSSKSTCPTELLAEDKMTLCKRATLAWRCVEMLVKGLPRSVRDVAMGTMKMVKMAVEEKCHEEKLTCYKCRGARSNEECNKHPQQKCDRDSNMCYTMVDNGMISKGCAPRIPFVEQKQCVDNGTKCAYMCYRSDCNMKTHEGLMDPPSCNRKMAVTCGIRMMHSMVMHEKPDCSALLRGMTCVHHHTKDCLSHLDGEISKTAVMLARNPLMLKCQVQSHDCTCGRCASVALGRVMNTPFTALSDVCRIALHTQKRVVAAVMTDKCGMEDMKELKSSVVMAKSLLGDSCDSPVEKMSYVHYNEKCDIKKAEMCMHAVDLSFLVKHSEKLGKHAVCSIFYKIMGCVRHSMESCDHMAAAMHLNDTIHKTLSTVSKVCDLTLAKELLSSKVKSEEEKMETVKHLMEVVGDSADLMMKKMEVIDEVMRTGVRSRMSACKPSLAMRYCHWELFMTPGTDPNFCSTAKKAWDCQMLYISQCLPVQAVPVYQAFYTHVSKDSKYCGYPLTPSKEEVKMLSTIPTYKLSVCVGDFITKLQLTYGNPVANSSMIMCKASVDLNNCVYHQNDMSAIGKVSRMEMAKMTSELMRVSCMGVQQDMSKVNCTKDDVLCHVLVNMTKMMNKVAESTVKEPSTCNVWGASFYLSNYVARLTVLPFSPMYDGDFICRDAQTTKMYIEGSIMTCSEHRREMFHQAVQWMHNLTAPYCKQDVSTSVSSCNKAMECLSKFGHYSIKMRITSVGDFCRKMHMALQCVSHHMSNCTASETTHIKDSLHIMGNTTKEYCPVQSEAICQLSSLESMDKSKTCDDTYGKCVTNYYDMTYLKELTKTEYCSYLMTASKCLFDNVRHCTTQQMKEYEDLMFPGLRSHDHNCTEVTAYYEQRMPKCEVTHCKMPEIMHELQVIWKNVSMMIESGKTQNEICNYATSQMKEHASMIAGCNSLQLYIIKYIKNTMLDGYLSQCPDVTPIPTDAVTPLKQCFVDLNTNMAAALKTPKYGFADICQSTMTMVTCMESAYANNMNAMMGMVMMQMNDTVHYLKNLLHTSCIHNTSMLVQISLPTESADCKVDTAINCVKLFSIRNLAYGVLPVDNDMFCTGAEIMKKCVEENVVKCSTTLQWQVKTMMTLNLMEASRTCKIDMMKMTPAEKATQMYTKLISFMTMARNWNNEMEKRRDDMMEDRDDMDDREGQSMMGRGDDGMTRGDDDMRDDDMGDDDMTRGADDTMTTRDDDMMENRGDKNMMGYDEHCNLYMANECLMSVMSNFDMVAPKVCNNKEYLAECVRPHIKSCDSMTKWMVHDSMSGPIKTMVEKACASHKMWAEYFGEDWLGTGEMKNEMRSEMRNAMDQRERSMELDEMRQKRKGEVEKIFENMNKIQLLVKFVRAERNPLEMDNAESGDAVEMIQKMFKMATNKTDCIEKDAFEGHGVCYPSAALECARHVDMEMMSPWGTKDRTCMKYALAVRCAMLSSQHCDYATTTHLHTRFHEVMGHVGDMCPTVIKDSCKMETKCQVKEVMSCLMPLHSKIMASLQLPMTSTGKLCGYIDLTKRCVAEKIEHCPEQMMYQLHNHLKPVMGMLVSMCETLPGQAYYTSMLWNMGSILLLDHNIQKTGSWHELLYLSKKYNKTIDMTKHMPDDRAFDVSQEYLQALTLLHEMAMMDKKKECTSSELMGNRTMMDDMMGQMKGSLMEELLNMVKYVLMTDQMMHTDQMFMKLARASMLNLQKDQSLKDLLDLTAHIVKKIHERPDMKDKSSIKVMNTVLKIIVGLGNGHEIVTSAYHTMAYIKIGYMMDKINELVMDEADRKEWGHHWDYLNMGLTHAIKEKMQKELTKYTIHLMELEMKPNDTKQLMDMMHVMKAKKLQACSSLIDIGYGAMEYMAKLPQNKQQLMNATLQSISGVATALCYNKKCHACEGAKTNKECNKQTPQQCDVAQVCYTHNENGMIYKGCGYDVGQTFGNTQFCETNMCNRNQYTVDRDDYTKCKPMEALMCLAGLVPVITREGEVDQRLVYNHMHCIENSVRECSVSDTRKMADIAHWIKYGLQESTCSGDDAEYECGMRSITGLALTVMSPGSPRISVCSQLNDTFHVLEWANKHKKCSDYEMMTAYKGLKMVMQVVGNDYCPGVGPDKESFCKTDMPKSSICNKTAALECMVRHKVMDMLMDKMSFEENVNFCWGLTDLFMCMENNTAGCDKNIDLTDVTMMFKQKIGQAVSHCPILEKNLDICHPHMKVQDAVCHPGLVHSQCFNIEKDGCSALDDKTKMENSLKCVHSLTNGCSSVQKLPVYYSVHMYMSMYLFSCGNNTIENMLAQKITDKKATYMDITIARLVAFVESQSLVMNFDKSNGMTPVMDLVHKLIMMRMNMTGMMHTAITNKSSEVMMKAKEFFGEMKKQRAPIQDDTNEIARCGMQFDTQMTVAVTFPTLFKVLYCETLHTYSTCMGRIEGHMVPKIFAQKMKNKFDGYYEMVCYDYLDEIADVGMTIAKFIGYKGNMSLINMDKMSDTNWTQLLLHLNKEDNECDSFSIASILTGISSLLVPGPFTNMDTYAAMCSGVAMAESMVKPMLDKCSEANKAVFVSVIDGIKYDSAAICYNPMMNTTAPDTCQDHKAFYCLASLMPLLSSGGTPDWQLCMHLSSASQCVSHALEHCDDQKKGSIYGTMTYLNSIAGERCPLLTAFTACYEPVTQTKCSLRGVKQCVANLTSCSGIPGLVKCVGGHSIGCSDFQMHHINGYMEMSWMDILSVCPEKDIIAQLYSKGTCQAPPTCSLAEAYECSKQHTGTDCSEVGSIVNCVESKTRGCNNAQYLLARTTLALNNRVTYPTCVTTSPALPATAGDEAAFNKLYICVHNYVTELPVSMDTDTPFTKGCDAYKAFISCLGEGTTDAEAYMAQLFLGNSFNVTLEVMGRFCDSQVMKDIAEVDDSDDTCDRKLVYQCMSVSYLHAMMASVMTKGDKQAFCSKSMIDYMANCKTKYMSTNCLKTTSNSIRGFHALIDSVNLLSNVCAEDLWTCAPQDAVFCGHNDTERMMNMSAKMASMNMSDSRNMAEMEYYRREMCSMYEESISCVKRLTVGCSKEINEAVKQSLSTSFCLSYDIYKWCPSHMEMTSFGLPQCDSEDNRMDYSHMTNNKTDDNTDRKAVDTTKPMTESGCSLQTVNTCIGMIFTELYGVMLDCDKFHRTYLRTMHCIFENSKTCYKENPAVDQVIRATANLAITAIYGKCPKVVNKPCTEKMSCGIEMAEQCLHKFDSRFNNNPNRHEADVCLANEATRYCSMEHTKECSILSQFKVPDTLDFKLRDWKINCDANPTLCLHKYYMTTISILHGDLTMAAMLKKIERMKFDVANMMMDTTKMEYMMGNATKMMSPDTDMIKASMKNFSGLSDVLDKNVIGMLQGYADILVGMMDSGDYMAVHTKVKMLQCVALHESWSCLMKKGDESGLPSGILKVLNVTLGGMFGITDSMCTRASVMSLAEEPKSCHILPAAVAFLNHITKLTDEHSGKEKFCLEKDLTDSIDKVKKYTESCSDSIHKMFDRLNSQVMEARDTICKAKSVCNETLAKNCITEYQKQMDCGTYEKAHTCVELHLQRCDEATANLIREQLQALSTQVSCEKMPKLKITGSPLRLEEGGLPVKVEISVEEDLSAWCPTGKSCRIQFDLEVDDGKLKCKDGTKIPQVVVAEETGVCQRTVNNQNWNTPVSYTLRARTDGRYDGTHNININVTAHKFVDGINVLTRVVSPLEAIVVEKDQEGLCRNTGGFSLITSFDNQQMLISQEGEFVLYKHTKYPQEVHTIYQKCTSNSRRLCTCAVMVQVGDDSLTIDKCRHTGGTDAELKVTSYQKGDLTTGMKLFANKGRTVLKVLMPTGTVVNVNIMSMRVWIIPSTLDMDRSEGLCGLYDGNKLNDAMTKDGSKMDVSNSEEMKLFMASWWVQSYLSIFAGVRNSVSEDWGNYCTCSSQESSGTCRSMMVAESCDLISGTDITALFYAGQTNNPTRRKRATNDPLSGLDIDYDFVASEPEWTNNWNETTARAYCENYLLKSEMGSKCITITSADFLDTDVESCIISIKEFGNTQGQSSSMESLKTKCTIEIEKGVVADTVLVAEILALSCPNDCSNNGQCTNGECQCFANYEQTSDCSVAKGTQPTVLSLQDGSLCELDGSSPCSDVTVMGQNFFESNSERTLSCHYETQGQSTVTVAATFITSTMVRCSGIPTTTSKKTWTITVTNSNNRQLATGTLGYTMYHPACYQCTDYQTCAMPNNPSGCLISDTCYKSGAVNTGNACQRCLPPETTTWSHVIGGSCTGYLSTQAPATTNGGQTGGNQGITPKPTTPPSDKDENVALIVLGCLTGGFALISIFLACKVCSTKEKEIKRRPDYSPSASDSASNKDFDNVHAFDNIGYDYPGSGGKPQYQPQGATPQKQPPVEDLPPPTKVVVDEERSKSDSDSLTNSASISSGKSGNEDYAFVDPAKKRVDRFDQAFSAPENIIPPDNGQVKKPEDMPVTEEKTVDINKDITIDIDTKPSE